MLTLIFTIAIAGAFPGARCNDAASCLDAVRELRARLAPYSCAGLRGAPPGALPGRMSEREYLALRVAMLEEVAADAGSIRARVLASVATEPERAICASLELSRLLEAWQCIALVVNACPDACCIGPEVDVFETAAWDLRRQAQRLARRWDVFGPCREALEEDLCPKWKGCPPPHRPVFAWPEDMIISGVRESLDTDRDGI